MASIGHVVDVYDGTGTHDTLDVVLNPTFVSTFLGLEPEEKRYVLIPFAEELVPVVSLEEGYLGIDPPEGLLRSCHYTKTKTKKKKKKE